MEQDAIDSDSSFESEDDLERERRAEMEYAEREEIYRKRIYEDSGTDAISLPIGFDVSLDLSIFNDVFSIGCCKNC